MTMLEWDKVGDRRFQTGVDRGVLYLPDGSAVPWNGLTSIAEDLGGEVKSYYSDGVKYLDHFVPGAYSAKLQAFTYPEELDDLLGTKEFAPGVFLHDQQAKPFNLSYRTLVGNDIEGTDHGYKIHILYNITANPGGGAMSTLSNQAQAEQFEWQLTGVPSQMFGIRPTSHVSVYSKTIDPDLLETLEGVLYGTPSVDAELPDFIALLDLIGNPS